MTDPDQPDRSDSPAVAAFLRVDGEPQPDTLAEHPYRRALAGEVHARPPTPIDGPSVITGLAFVEVSTEQSVAWIRHVAADAGRPLGEGDPAHVVLDFPGLRLKWERHGEFFSLALVVPLAEHESALQGASFPSALHALRAGWRASLPGRLVAATDVVLAREVPADSIAATVSRWLNREATSGAHVLDQAATVYTDFTLEAQGRTRWLVFDRGMGALQTARTVQRLLEIEIYRMMALLALPLARTVFSELSRLEAKLAVITAAASNSQPQTQTQTPFASDRLLAAQPRDDRRLLDELTALAADIERSIAAGAFRFPAALAYWEIVRARLSELREQRIDDLRTLTGFMNRRMAPAMNTCAAAAKRQADLSARVERAGAMLRTRVDIAREEQNQRLLAAMDGTARQQLRLQQTVEGLSTAAITYYVVGLIGYFVKPLEPALPAPLQVSWLVAAAVPLVAWGVWQGVHRVREALDKGEREGEA
jgi:uncharacterized membrane-anchored protein